MIKWGIFEVGYSYSAVFDNKEDAVKFLASLSNSKNKKISKKILIVKEVEVDD
jgi:hypothetical protein